MADRTETVILEFEVDESEAIESINSLAAANKALRKERNELNLSTEAGKKKAAELNAVIDSNTDKIKDNSSALEKQKMNIGNYSSALDKLVPGLGGIANKLDVLSKSTGGVASGIYTMLKAGLAFIATPIGAVLAAIGVALGSLIKYFQSSEEGQNRLNKIMAVASAIFEQFLNVVEAVGEAVYNAVSNPQQAIKDFGNLIKDQIVNRFMGLIELIPNLGRAVSLLFQGKFSEAAKVAGDAVGKVTLGIEGATDKITELVKSTGDAVNKGIEYGKQISALNAQIDKEERKMIEDRAATNLKVAKLRQQAVEAEGAAKITAIKQAIALEEDLAKRETQLAQKRLDLSLLQVEANGDDKDALNNVAQARADLTQKEAAAYDNTLKFRKQLEALNQEAAQSAKEAADDAAARKRAANLPNVSDKDPVIEAEFKKAAVTLDIRERLAKDVQKINEKQTLEERKNAEEQIKINEMVEQQKLQATQAVAGAILSVLDDQSSAYKAIATASALISTYTAATKAYEAAFLPIPTIASPALGTAFAADAVIQGLANVAKINGVEFAEGGWTGPGSKYQVAGTVHADEYVVPKHIVNSAAGSAHISALERMRLTPYADGGFVTGSVSQPINQNLQIGDLLRNMPAPVVSVKEITRKQKSITVKEKIARR